MPHRSADRTLVRTVGAIAAALAAVTLSACSGSSGGGASSTPAPATVVTTTTVPPVAPTSTAATTPSAAPSASSAGSGGSAGAAACRESQLRAQLDPRPVSGDVADEKVVIVQFVNTSSTSCTMHGYPGAAIIDSSGAQVVQATRTIRGKVLGLPASVHTLPTVTLKPGAVASAGIEGVNKKLPGSPQGGCDTDYPGILVTPPNTTEAVPFSVKWPTCYTFTVHPTNIDRTAN